MDIIQFFQQNVIDPVTVAGAAFVENVAKPFWTSFTSWISGYTEIESLSEFASKVFRMRLNIRIYSFMLMIPIFIFLMLFIKLIMKVKRANRNRRFKKKVRRRMH